MAGWGRSPPSHCTWSRRIQRPLESHSDPGIGLCVWMIPMVGGGRECDCWDPGGGSRSIGSGFFSLHRPVPRLALAISYGVSPFLPVHVRPAPVSPDVTQN